MRTPVLSTLMLMLMLIVCIVMSTAEVPAQTLITGHVTDATGIGLPGVRVTATTATRRTPWAATTDGDGWYDLIGLSSDVYTLSFSVPGFTRALRHVIVVEPDCRIPLDVQLRTTPIVDGLIVTGVPPHAVPAAPAMDHGRHSSHDRPRRPTGSLPTPRWLPKSVEDSCWGFRPMWILRIRIGKGGHARYAMLSPRPRHRARNGGRCRPAPRLFPPTGRKYTLAETGSRTLDLR